MLNNFNVAEIVYSSEEMQLLIEGEYLILSLLILALTFYLCHLLMKFLKQFFDF